MRKKIIIRRFLMAIAVIALAVTKTGHTVAGFLFTILTHPILWNPIAVLAIVWATIWIALRSWRMIQKLKGLKFMEVVERPSVLVKRFITKEALKDLARGIWARVP